MSVHVCACEFMCCECVYSIGGRCGVVCGVVWCGVVWCGMSGCVVWLCGVCACFSGVYIVCVSGMGVPMCVVSWWCGLVDAVL